LTAFKQTSKLVRSAYAILANIYINNGDRQVALESSHSSSAVSAVGDQTKSMLERGLVEDQRRWWRNEGEFA